MLDIFLASALVTAIVCLILSAILLYLLGKTAYDVLSLKNWYKLMLIIWNSDDK